jgi:DNA-binding response OmpR family regulator
MSSTEDAPAPLRLLVVEDDPVSAHMVTHVLLQNGFAVMHAIDGREAIEILEMLPPTALIVLDLMLPLADGFTIIERARALPAWADVPIIMVTGKSQERTVLQALGAGVAEYLVKPVAPAELLSKVRRLTGRSAAV